MHRSSRRALRAGLGSGTFTVSGWAISLDPPVGPGVDAIHVWAFPVGAGAPRFVGAATPGGARPDVAALFGPAYEPSGFSLNVSGLPSGTWDLAVFARVTGAVSFSGARVVRITVP